MKLKPCNSRTHTHKRTHTHTHPAQAQSISFCRLHELYLEAFYGTAYTTHSFTHAQFYTHGSGPIHFLLQAHTHTFVHTHTYTHTHFTLTQLKPHPFPLESTHTLFYTHIAQAPSISSCKLLRLLHLGAPEGAPAKKQGHVYFVLQGHIDFVLQGHVYFVLKNEDPAS
jgi:hypothetical protein